MSLSVGDALRDGLGRTFERNGLQLIAVFVGLRLASAVADDTLTEANLALARELGTVPNGGPIGGLIPGLGEVPTPFALGLGLTSAAGLALLVALLGEAIRIVAVRTLVSERVDTIPSDHARRDIVKATLNGFVGGVVVLTLTAFGLVLFVVPGVFLALSFFFVRQEIAVRDVNFVDAMSGSWALTAGNRLGLLALAVAIGLAGLVAAIPGLLVGTADPLAGTAVGAVASAVVVVFGIASVSRAYVQLQDAGEDDGDDRDVDPWEGALTADDLPEPGSVDDLEGSDRQGRRSRTREA